ncbi:MAG: arginine--tRNA ligase, partial [Lachnospiraceae bacterium]|nr:arginine--tRNA ligase [Lachnospiraceae bacterium]
MKKIIEQLADELRAAFAACGYEERFGMISVSNRPDLCQYQCNGAMAAAKQYKKAPIAIANEIVEKCGANPIFKSFEAVMPGFINITLSDAYLSGVLKELAQDERLGCEAGEPKSIVIDYGGPNVAKPLHVGHLRSAIIGESIKRLKRFMGDHIVGDIHLGDWGLQMGLIIEELRDRQPELVYFQEGFTGEFPAEPPFTLGELEELYPAASARSKEDESFKERAHQAILRIQRDDPAYTALWRHIMSVSLPD